MMLTNGYIYIGIVIGIVGIVPSNPKYICNVYAFSSILENKYLKNKVILKLQTPF